MLTRKQSRELELQKQLNKKNNSSKNTSLSSELQEGVLVEMLEILDKKNQIQIEEDDQNTLIDPQLKRIEDYNNHYKSECLSQLTFDQIDLTQCLANHKIREWVRGKMVDWMVEVFADQQNDVGFFRAISLMDAFLRYSYNYTDSEMYLIGITCIFIASKIEDIYHISISTVSQVLSHNKYTEFQIKEQESTILESLNYDTNFPTHYDYLQFLHYQLFGLSNNQSVQIIQETSAYILKMCHHDYGIMQYRQVLLASCILGYTIQTFMDQHNKMTNQLSKTLQQTQHNLMKISQIELVDYMECLQKIDELIQNFNYKYPQYENLRRFY